MELPVFKLDVNRVLIGNSPVRLLDLENNTIEDKTDELFRADCFAKVNDEFVIYGGIYRFFFLNTKTWEKIECSYSDNSNNKHHINMINDREFYAYEYNMIKYRIEGLKSQQ